MKRLGKGRPRYRHVKYFGLTLIGVVVVDYLFLSYTYISFFRLLADLATLHLIYIISHNKLAENILYRSARRTF
jgi:hypothetical protein